jgi:hypothetical protein
VASPLQQQSLFRKIGYIVLILVLFTATLALRRSSSFGIDAQAQAMEISEESLGQVELTDSAVRLMLTGSRGLAVCSLWLGAIEKQKKHEWNEMELLVKSVTKLQPHFVTPWIFQSWNLAYNVSVESDLIRDKYYYISKGIALLAEGEKLNRNNPDMRFQLGTYNQQKIGLSDESNTLRCLYQMSCIDPVERDANRLRRADDPNSVDMVKFEQFCQRHPMLVRRLREQLRCNAPSDVVDFLAENRKIPSRYEDKPKPSEGGLGERTDLLAIEQQFPILPPEGTIESGQRADPTAIDFDNFQVGRDWFAYAQLPVPPADPTGSLLNPSFYDQRKYRMPKRPAINIFRTYPARDQAYYAEYLGREGWFDEAGWRINGWFPDDKFSNGEDAVVGKDTPWSARAWSRANEMYRELGERTGMYLEPDEEKKLDERAQLFRDKVGIQRDLSYAAFPADLRGQRDYEDSYLAHLRLYWCDFYRKQTNFLYFYYKTLIESKPKAVQMRKTLFEADQLRKAGEREQALEKYREALPVLRDLLLAYPGFRRESLIQDDSYSIAMEARQLFEDMFGKRLPQLATVVDYLGQAAVRPPLPVPWTPPLTAVRDVYMEIGTVLDGKDSKGVPLISMEDKYQVRARLGLKPPPAEQQPPRQSSPKPKTAPAG